MRHHRLPALALIAAVPVLTLGPSTALARDLILTGGEFGVGYTLPLSSLAGLLGFFAVGLWAGQTGRGAIVWQWPAVALAGAVFASVISQAGVIIPHTEQGLMVALGVVGGLMVFGNRLPWLNPLAVVALVGLFEGYPLVGAMHHSLDIGSWVGFSVAALLAMAGGLGVALMMPSLFGFRLFGAGIAISGIAMLFDKI